MNYKERKKIGVKGFSETPSTLFFGLIKEKSLKKAEQWTTTLLSSLWIFM